MFLPAQVLVVLLGNSRKLIELLAKLLVLKSAIYQLVIFENLKQNYFL